MVREEAYSGRLFMTLKMGVSKRRRLKGFFSKDGSSSSRIMTNTKTVKGSFLANILGD